MLSFSLFSGYSAAELENWGSDRLAVLVGAYLSYVTGADSGRVDHVRQLVHAEAGGERVLDGISCRVFERVCRGSGCEGSLGEGGGDISRCASSVPISEAGSSQGKIVHGGSVCGLDVRVSGPVVVEERESVACHGDGSGAGLSGFDPASDGVEGTCAARGKNYESNKKKREQRKRRAKAARMAGDWRSVGSCKSEPDSEVEVDQNVPTLAEFVSAKIDEEFVDSRALEVEMKVAERVAMQKAKKTLADKWAVENELAAAKARRALEILMAQDVQAEIKRQATYLKLQTEKNMVGMEKAHQFLKKTGNVPGFAQTVLSDEGLTDGSSASPASPGECTISPDSSASMKEFREVVKQKADLEEKLARICKMTKVSLEDLDDYDKNTWSLKSENYEKLDRMYPGGYILDPVPDYVDYDPPTHGYLKF